MLDFARTRILSRQGGFLRPLDAHDIMCAVGDAAVSGGVRRTAMISLFDYDDQEMRHCKDGDFWRNNSQRWNANNSAVWPERELTQAEITRFVLDMVESGRGEPGIFNRKAAMENQPARRKVAEFGTNPCGEIMLRPYQFCNLTSAVARADDDSKVCAKRWNWRPLLARFNRWPPISRFAREMERKLSGRAVVGRGFEWSNGQPSRPRPRNSRRGCVKSLWKRIEQYAEMLGINQSAATTCVKPSGNSSQTAELFFWLTCALGTLLHSQCACRRAFAQCSRCCVMLACPWIRKMAKRVENAITWVVHFPVKSPETAVTRNDRTALGTM